MRVSFPLPPTLRREGDEHDIAPAYPSRPVPKQDHPFEVISPTGNRICTAASPTSAAVAAALCGSGTEVWLNGRRVGAYVRGRRSTTTQAQAVRRLRRTIECAAREITARVRAYRARIEAVAA